MGNPEIQGLMSPHRQRLRLEVGSVRPIGPSSAGGFALASFYDQTSPLAYGLALRILADGAAAEGVLAETYAEARRRGRVGLEPRNVVWLLREVRARSLASRAFGRTAPRRPAARVDGSVPFESRDRGALDGLGPMDRELLQLAYFDGLSSRDIAGRVGVDEKTVRQRLRAALGLLHERSHAAEEAGS